MLVSSPDISKLVSDFIEKYSDGFLPQNTLSSEDDIDKLTTLYSQPAKQHSQLQNVDLTPELEKFASQLNQAVVQLMKSWKRKTLLHIYSLDMQVKRVEKQRALASNLDRFKKLAEQIMKDSQCAQLIRTLAEKASVCLCGGEVLITCREESASEAPATKVQDALNLYIEILKALS